MPLDQLMDAILRADPKFIGDVHRLSRSGKTPQEIADKFGHKNTMNVSGFLYAIQALKGEIDVSELKSSSRKQLRFVVDRYLTMAKEPQITEHLELLSTKLKALEGQTPSAHSPSESAPSLSVNRSEVALAAKPGVYVYSYPQYLSMESVSPDGRAFYKIGASGKVANRVERQKRQTEVPEDLVLVRVFYDENPFELEEKFHSILRAANMHQKTTQGGVEWFSCNLATIDAIAASVMGKL